MAEGVMRKKINSLNSRIRGLRVFFKFCAEREYMKPISPKLMKTDVEVKEPYTEAELYLYRGVDRQARRLRLLEGPRERQAPALFLPGHCLQQLAGVLSHPL